MRCSRAAIAAFTVGAIAVTDASAGPRPYAFAQGIDTLPGAELELESWFSARALRDDGPTIWDWWFGPVTGITDRLEAALFARFVQVESAAAPEALVLSSLRLQLFYSLADKGSWPVDVRLRLELVQPIADRATHEIWFLLVASRDLGRLNLTANLGGWLRLGTIPNDGDQIEPYLSYAAAASVDLGLGLRLGAELFGDAAFDALGHDHFAGLDLAYGTGRFWLTAGVALGLGDESAASFARLVLGVQL